MGLIAHEIVLRDPLDGWCRFDLGDHRYDQANLRDAIGEHRLYRSCVAAGFLTFAPLPADLDPDYEDTRRLGMEQVLRLAQRQSIDLAVTANPAFARAVLKTLPVSDSDWPLVAVDGDGETAEQIMRYRLENLDRFADAAEEVREAAEFNGQQLAFAAACTSDFIARGAVGAAFQAAAAREAAGLYPRSLGLQAWDVCESVEFPDLARVGLDDVAAIREHDDAFQEWRSWFGRLCSEAEALASGTNTDLREQFERSLGLAQQQLHTSARGQLRAYVQDRQAHADLVTLGLGVAGTIATGSPIPALSAGGNSAFSLIRRTLLRRQTPAGWQGILMTLTGSDDERSSRSRRRK